MSYLIQFQINIFSLLILSVLFIFVRLSTIKTYSKYLINLIIIFSALGIIDEPLSWIFDQRLFEGAYLLNYATNFCLYLLGPITAGLLMSYVDYRVFKNRQRIGQRFFYQQATAVTLVVLLVNFINPIYFVIDPITNIYVHASYTFVHYIVIFTLYCYMVYFLVVNRKLASYNELRILIGCFLVPVVAMAGQLYDSHLHLAWTSTVFIIMAIYIFLETAPMEEDHLTKLYNRKSYEQHLEYLIQTEQNFAILVIDLDNFKDINDGYGHKKGDEVLYEFSLAIRKVFFHKGLCARIGGDEFSVVISCQNLEIANHIATLEQILVNHENPLMAQLKFSYGFQGYENSMSFDDIFILADNKMYQDKSRIKTKYHANQN